MQISHSGLNLFKSCPRKFYWRYFAGIERKYETSPPRLLGKAWHHGLDVKRKTMDMSQAINASWAYIDKESGDTDELSETKAKLEAYHLGYENHFYDMTRVWQSSEREIVTDNDICIIDGIVYNDEGVACIVEDKTRSMPTQNIELYVTLNEQLLHYCDILQQIGEPVYTCIYRETVKTKLRKKLKETEEQFRDRLIESYLIGDNFHEGIITFDKKGVDNYRNEKELWINWINICNGYKEIERWPRNSEKCYSPYGKCEFLELCSNAKIDHSQCFQANEKESMDDGFWRKKFGVTRDEKIADTRETADLPDTAF